MQCVCVGIFKDVKEYTCREDGEGKTSHTDSSDEQIFPLKGMLWEAAAPLGIGMHKLPPFWVMDFASALWLRCASPCPIMLPIP